MACCGGPRSSRRCYCISRTRRARIYLIGYGYDDAKASKSQDRRVAGWSRNALLDVAYGLAGAVDELANERCEGSARGDARQRFKDMRQQHGACGEEQYL